MKINMETNLERFAKAYRKHLKEAVTADPQNYAYAADRTDIIADRMLAALEKKTASKDGYAFKKTCKELGIKHTYQAIYAYLEI